MQWPRADDESQLTAAVFKLAGAGRQLTDDCRQLSDARRQLSDACRQLPGDCRQLSDACLQWSEGYRPLTDRVFRLTNAFRQLATASRQLADVRFQLPPGFRQGTDGVRHWPARFSHHSPVTSTRRSGMSRFPKTEAEIAALAALVVEGFTKAPEYFPTPPVPTADLKAKLEAFQASAAGGGPGPTNAAGSRTPKHK